MNKHCPAIRIVAECGSVAEALDAIPANKPDLVFLDIMLPDGTGFEILERIEQLTFKVIFTSAHDEYAIRAIGFSALDYLLKPVCVDELVAAVEKAGQTSAPATAQKTQIRLLRENLGHTSDGAMQMALPTIDGFNFVTLSDIVSCEAKGNYSECVTCKGEVLLVCRTLKEFEELLSDRGFFESTIHTSSI